MGASGADGSTACIQGRALLHVDEVAVKDEDAGREPNVKAMFKEGDAITVRGCAFLWGCRQLCFTPLMSKRRCFASHCLRLWRCAVLVFSV